jgi:hypothetical protein
MTMQEKLEYLLNHPYVDEVILYPNGGDGTYAIRLLRPFGDGTDIVGRDGPIITYMAKCFYKKYDTNLEKLIDDAYNVMKSFQTEYLP